MKKAFLLSIILFSSFFIYSQLPQTAVYSFGFKQEAEGKISLTTPKYLSIDNKDGYNNQPNFIDNKTIYLSTQMKNWDQTEIRSFDLYNRKTRLITNTKDAEYSPTLMPDGNHFSCVRVENDGKETQRLWKFPINRSNNGEVLFPLIKGVGYHCWLSESLAALFIVGEPHRLVIADLESQKFTEITSKIGRGMQQMPNGNLAFIQKLGDSSWYIKELNIETLKAGIIIETLEGSEDFIILSDNTFMMAKGSKIFTFNPIKDRDWKEVLDLQIYGITQITRIAYNGARTLIVVDKKG